MARFVLQRLWWAVIVVLAVVIINFFITRVLPGDPVGAIVGEYPVPKEYIDHIRHSLGLDRPLVDQLGLYLLELTRGHLGFSFSNRQDVLDLVVSRALATLLLMIPGLIGASVLGLWLARIAIPRQGGLADVGITAITLFGYSVPVFWLGQLLVLLFAVQLGWLPAQGMHSLRNIPTGLALVGDFLVHAILPEFCIVIFYAAIVARVARASIGEALGQDFVITARAKGLSRRRVFWRHVLPNALTPIVTVIGYNFGYALTGAILLEAVFAWPGLGTLFIKSVATRDYPVLDGIFLVSAIAIVAINFLTDVVCGLIDPRIRSAHAQAL